MQELINDFFGALCVHHKSYSKKLLIQQKKWAKINVYIHVIKVFFVWKRHFSYIYLILNNISISCFWEERSKGLFFRIIGFVSSIPWNPQKWQKLINEKNFSEPHICTENMFVKQIGLKIKEKKIFYLRVDFSNLWNQRWLCLNWWQKWLVKLISNAN